MTNVKILAIVLGMSILVQCVSKKEKKEVFPAFEVGVVADCQYCDCAVSGIRHYQKGTERLRKAVNELNRHELDHCIHLGDFIDRDFTSFDSVAPIWNSLRADGFHVLGNHDFSVADSLKPMVLARLNLKDRYYSLTRNNWRFLILDGNDLSKHGALNENKIRQTDSLLNLPKYKDQSNMKMWNGGLGREQLRWIENELKLATANGERVGFYCHFPVFAASEDHNLWNFDELQSVIDNYPCVKFYFNGHNHAGGYTEKDGVHYLNFKGMVNTRDSTSFARVLFKEDSIIVKGYGREPSRRLQIK